MTFSVSGLVCYELLGSHWASSADINLSCALNSTYWSLTYILRKFWKTKHHFDSYSDSGEENAPAKPHILIPGTAINDNEDTSGILITPLLPHRRIPVLCAPLILSISMWYLCRVPAQLQRKSELQGEGARFGPRQLFSNAQNPKEFLIHFFYWYSFYWVPPMCLAHRRAQRIQQTPTSTANYSQRWWLDKRGS